MRILISFLKNFIFFAFFLLMLASAFLLGRYSRLFEEIIEPEIVFLPSDQPESAQASPSPLLPIQSPNQLPSKPITASWGGPELWQVVNQKRIEYGVNPLKQKNELCTIAAIRLNEILELGRLDAHAGFSNLPETRPDLRWIFEKYNLYEFLVSGAESAEKAVSLWENTLGHKLLLSGGEFVWGCTYAADGFGVAIAAF